MHGDSISAAISGSKFLTTRTNNLLQGGRISRFYESLECIYCPSDNIALESGSFLNEG